jgi:hypothetical protein
VGKAGTGLIWLFTAGCFAIGWFTDIVLVLSGKFKDTSERLILPPPDITKDKKRIIAIVVVAVVLMLCSGGAFGYLRA